MNSGRVNSNTQMQRALCLVLCVAAWRGPVPMLHDHQAITNAEVRERHERVFHPLARQECIGLHWHFAFPHDVNEKPLPVSDEVAPDLAVFACAAASQSMSSCSLEGMMQTLEAGSNEFPVLVCADDASSERAKVRPKSFLSSLLCDVPLTAITGVCLL